MSGSNMPSNIITTKMAIPFAAEIESRLPILMNLNTNFDKNFVANNGVVIQLIIPGFGNVSTGPSIAGLDLSYLSGSVSVTLVQRVSAVSLTSVEQSLALDNFDDQIAMPYGARHASEIQKVAANELMLKCDTNTIVGTGTGGFTDIGKAIAAVRAARSSGQLYGAVQPDLATQIMNSGITFFNPSTAISKSFFEGELGKFRGAEWNETPDVTTLVTGDHTWGAGTTVTGVVTDSTTLTLTATGGTATISGTYKSGEIITLASVLAVDVFGVSLTQSYSFTVLADTLCGGTATQAITIKPVYLVGPLKNVSISAFGGSFAATEVTAKSSTYIRGVVWDKQAAVYASAKLPPLAMARTANEFKHADGKALSVLVQVGSDIMSGLDIFRMETLTGFLLARSNWVAGILVKV